MNMIQTGMISYEERLQSIFVLNLSYLLLAQRLIKQDRYAASFMLGMSNDVIDMIEDLPLSQLIRLASTDRLICQLRIDDAAILHSVTKRSRLDALQGVHTGIILSTRLLKAAEKKESAAQAAGTGGNSSSAAEKSVVVNQTETLLAL